MPERLTPYATEKVRYVRTENVNSVNHFCSKQANMSQGETNSHGKLSRLGGESTPTHAGPESEEALQAAWADFLRVSLPVDAVHHHSPNEGKRGWRAQRALKASGCAAGWPDSEIVWQGKIYFLELKMPGRKPTKLQAERHEELRRAGAMVAVGTSLNELVGAIVAWGIPLRLTLSEFERLRTAGRMTAAQYRAMQPTAKAKPVRAVRKLKLPARKPKR